MVSLQTEPPMEIDLVSGSFWGGDAHEALRWMRANDPVHWDGRVWGVSTHELVKEVSRRTDTFSSAEGCRPDAPAVPMMIDMDDPAHQQRRKLVSRGFTPRRVREAEPHLLRTCDEIIDAVVERGSCDFVDDIAAWLPLIVIGEALGFPREAWSDLLRWSDDLLGGLVGGDVESATSMLEAYESFRAFVLPAIESRRASPTTDLLSALVHAEVDGARLDDEEIIHEALLILIGGDETTRHVISGGMYQLLRHPDQLRDLRDDRTLLPVAVEEMLRWVSPIRNMNRTVTADVELGGRTLRAGDKVLLLYPSANRDETVFDDPDRFDIRRQPNDHVAFGFGTHFCLGASLARLELRCMIDRLLTRLPDLELVDDAEPANRAANFVSGYERMPVRFSPGPRLST